MHCDDDLAGLARPWSTCADDSFVCANGNVLSMTARNQPASYSTEGVDDEVLTCQLCGEVLLGVVDDDVSAQVSAPVSYGGAGGGRDDGATVLGALDDGGPLGSVSVRQRGSPALPGR